MSNYLDYINNDSLIRSMGGMGDVQPPLNPSDEKTKNLVRKTIDSWNSSRIAGKASGEVEVNFSMSFGGGEPPSYSVGGSATVNDGSGGSGTVEISTNNDGRTTVSGHGKSGSETN